VCRSGEEGHGAGGNDRRQSVDVDLTHDECDTLSPSLVNRTQHAVSHDLARQLKSAVREEMRHILEVHSAGPQPLDVTCCIK